MEACPSEDFLQFIRYIFKDHEMGDSGSESVITSGFWKQPKPLRATVVMLCVSRRGVSVTVQYA